MTILQIKVTPNASKNEILGYKQGFLCIRIKGVPEKGRVNEELIEFLSEVYDVPKSQIQILSGHTSRLKRVEIKNLSKD